MFNKSKKYGIIKGLPFVCFANINGMDDSVKSGENQINLVVDGDIYTLKNDVVIFDNKTDAILKLNDILKSKEYKKGDDFFNKEPMDSKILGTNCKITKYKIEGVDEQTVDKVEDSIGKLNANTLNGKKLTITVESLYKLGGESILFDGKNTVKIENLEFLFSDLNDKNSIGDLMNVIKTKCLNDAYKFGTDEGGCLKDIKVADINLDNVYISFIAADNDVTTDKIINAIKNKTLKLTFSPYIKYVFTTENFELSKDLEKIRKLKDLTEFLTELNSKTEKLTEAKDRAGIQVLIKECTDCKDIDIDTKDGTKIEKIESALKLQIIKDDNCKLSDVMKGTIKFEIEGSKKSELTFEEGKGSDLLIKFGDKINSSSGKVVNTEMTQEEFKAELKTLFSVLDEAKYGVAFTNFDVDKAKDDFIVTVAFKDVIPNFTKKLAADEQNITINLVIDNNADNKFELTEGLTNTHIKAFTKSLKYKDFITELEKMLSKGKDTLDGAIKEVKYTKDGKADVLWKSDDDNTIEALGIKSVTITLKQNDNGVYVKKKDEPKPKPKPVEGKTRYTLKVSCVQGYKIKDPSKKSISVDLENSKLTASELYEKVKAALSSDDNFIIKKGGIDVTKDGSNLDKDDTNAYSVELTKNSNLIVQDKKDDEGDKNKQNGGSKDEQNGDTKDKKGCCGGKCSPKDKK